MCCGSPGPTLCLTAFFEIPGSRPWACPNPAACSPGLAAPGERLRENAKLRRVTTEGASMLATSRDPAAACGALIATAQARPGAQAQRCRLLSALNPSPLPPEKAGGRVRAGAFSEGQCAAGSFSSFCLPAQKTAGGNARTRSGLPGLFPAPESCCLDQTRLSAVRHVRCLSCCNAPTARDKRDLRVAAGM